MTKEEAIDRLKEARAGHKEFLSDETLNMAIKSLEQESTEMIAKEADNVRNSLMAIEATQRMSCESYKFCKSCEDIAMAFQIGLLFGKADKAIEEVKKSITPQSCDDAISRQAVLDKMKERDEELSSICPKDIRDLPSVTPQPKMGKWIGDKCSICGEERAGYGQNPPYCPDCGSYNGGAE